MGPENLEKGRCGRQCPSGTVRRTGSLRTCFTHATRSQQPEFAEAR